MATGRSEFMSDEVANIKCSICVQKGKTVEAEKYCLECKDYYCSSCIDIHTIISALKGHTLLDKTDFRSSGTEKCLPSFPTQRCSMHQSDVVNMYCKDHDLVACPCCIAISHRACTNIHLIADEVDNLYNGTELTSFKMKINLTNKSVKEIKKVKEAMVEELKTSFVEAVESVKKYREEIGSVLDRLEQESIRELKNDFERKEQCLQEKIKETVNTINSLDEMTSSLTRAEGNKAQEFVSIKSSEKVMAMAEDLQKQEQQCQSDIKVSFTSNKNIIKFLNQQKILGQDLNNTLLGQDSNSTLPGQESNKTFLGQDSSNTLLGKESDNTPSKTTFSPKTTMYKVKKQRDIQVKHFNDTRDCQIYGSCITNNGFLLLTDLENKRLKRLDMSTETVKDFVCFSAGPIAVCQVSDTEVAVTLTDKSIKFVNLESSLRVIKTLKMNHFCSGIAFAKDRLFISNQKRTVFIYNLFGAELGKITDGKFSGTNHIAAVMDGERVIVADDNGLVVLDAKGNHLSSLKNSILHEPRDVCTDGRNVFITGNASNNIVQIGHDYQFLGEIGQIKNPVSICFDHRKTRLFVTQNHKNNKITVIDLE